MAFLMISRSNIIIILCVFLIMVGIIQGKMKKPKRIRLIEQDEEQKLANYKDTSLEVTKIENSFKCDFEQGKLGVRDKFLTFFSDEEVFHEGWKVFTRVEALVIEFSSIEGFNLEKEDIISIYTNSNELKEKTYKFKANHVEEIDNFICFLKNEKDRESA